MPLDSTRTRLQSILRDSEYKLIPRVGKTIVAHLRGKDTMTKFTIRGTLPGLNDYISAERTHRYAGAAMKKQSEAIVQHAARALGKAHFDKPVHMIYRWFEPTRRRDKDNISAFGRKVIQDALVRCGVLANDGWAQISGFEDQFFLDKKSPRIEVQIYEIDE